MARFLLVDDSKIARNILKNIIIAEGHEVVAEAATGLDGYDMYVKHKPDVVTLDITMPILNGVDCLKRILEDFPDAKVIMVTSLHKDKLRDETLAVGAKNVLPKPFQEEKALEVIRNVLAEK